MKKELIIIAICSILLFMPISMALPVYNNNMISLDDPPDWASNYFVGYVGVTNQSGGPQIPAGYIIGYVEDDFKGKYAGIIAVEENEDPEPVGFLAGYIIGPFLLGVISNISTDQQTFMVGLGMRNETHFYFRLMAIVGPTYYMAGIYSELED
jgi:hypothetical protein